MKKVFAFLLLLSLCFSLVSCGGKKSDSFRVGVLQFAPHPALDAATEGFQDALKDKLGDKVVFDVKNASGEQANCSTIANGFVNDQVDLIMANATPAVNACANATDKIPILGTSVTEYGAALGIDDFSGASGRNVSGTSDLAPLDEQAKMVKDIFPQAKKVGILFCSGEANSKYQVKMVSQYLTDLGLTAVEFAFTDTNDISAVTQAACDECDVLYIPTDNTAANCAETINNVALNSKTPIICGEENLCKGCGVATLSISYYDLGYQTGLMAYKVLVEGQDIKTLQVEYAPETKHEFNQVLAEVYGLTFGSDYEALNMDE
ncbi:MAG: ABC transporter substrate-binding protein [Oscillospiraceae bacterium]|nr:ABC transporter substrate-binding protein [Oscillospiraceae bacterium]MBR0452204.1 ABC transporter substrate-binding protein [Oscillospiraceae bacterium]